MGMETLLISLIMQEQKNENQHWLPVPVETGPAKKGKPGESTQPGKKENDMDPKQEAKQSTKAENGKDLEKPGKSTQSIKGIDEPSEPNKSNQTNGTIDEVLIDTEEQLLILEGQAKGVDYNQLFLYLGNLKESDFSYNTFYSMGTAKELRMDDEMHVTNRIDDSIIREVLKASKLKNSYGLDSYVHPTHKALFDMWKMTNNIDLKIRYDMMSI